MSDNGRAYKTLLELKIEKRAEEARRRQIYLARLQEVKQATIRHE